MGAVAMGEVSKSEKLNELRTLTQRDYLEKET